MKRPTRRNAIPTPGIFLLLLTTLPIPTASVLAAAPSPSSGLVSGVPTDLPEELSIDSIPLLASDSVNFVLDPVTVHATRSTLPLFQVPLSVSVLQGAALERRMAASVGDILAGLPNVTVVGGPRRQAELPVIRGFSADRLVVRIDGVRQQFQSGHKGRLFLEPDLVRRAEVVRGPSSTVHGSGGLGGVLAFETVTARDLLRGDEEMGVQVRPAFRTGASEWRGAVTVFGSREGFAGGDRADLLLSAGGRSNDDLRLGDGSKLPFSAADYTDLLAKVGWGAHGIGRFDITYDRFSETSITPLQADADNRDDSQVGDRSSEREGLRMGWRGSWSDSALEEIDAAVYRNSVQLDERRLSDGRLDLRRVRTLGVDLVARTGFDLGAATRLTVVTGVEGYEDDATGSRDGAVLGAFPTGSSSFAAAFLQPTITLLDRVSVMPAIRWDRYSFSSADPNLPGRTDSERPLKLALGIEPAGALNLFGSVSQGFSAPRLLSLYASGLHFPGGGPVPNNFFVPNPELEPERTRNVEAGLRLRGSDLLTGGDGILFEAVRFRSRATDFIAQEVDTFGGTTIARNVDRVTVSGLEASVRWEAPTLSAGLSHGRVRQADRSSGDPLDSAPADTWALNLGLRLPDRGIAMGYRGILTERQDRVTEADLETPGYAVSDIFASWSPGGPRWEGMEVSARVSNLFDRTYQRHGLPILAPGREVRISVGWRGGR